MIETKKIKKGPAEFVLEYSICTIINNAAEYELMKNSCIEKGFTGGCEYIIADNTAGNEFDAYQAISHFLKTATGRYIIIVHQDVRLIDNRETLNRCLSDLEHKDPKWAICGNAGAQGYHQDILHITHESHTRTVENAPVKVNSLDENLLIIKANSNLTISPDLKGFHLYGTDLCIIAHFLGYSCYVIAFMVLHLSEGNISSLNEQEAEFTQRYGEKMNIGYLQTTCTQFYLSNSKFKNKLLNSPFFFFIIKQFQRYPYLFQKWTGKKK